MMTSTMNLQRHYQRVVLTGVSYVPRRLALVVLILVLISVSAILHYRPLLTSNRMGFMYAAEISGLLRTDPASIHDSYIQTWRERLIRADDLPYNLTEPSKVDFSRGQSRVVLALTGKKDRGFFVDIGGGDGETNSVTLGLELQAQWDGVIVESDLIKFRQLLRKHRRANCLHARISFGKPTDSHRDTSPSQLDLLPSDLFQMINRTQIDLLSINLRDQELDFLWSVNFHLHTVKIVTIEMQADVSKEHYLEMTSVLARRGYRVSHHIVDGRSGKKDIIYARD